MRSAGADGGPARIRLRAAWALRRDRLGSATRTSSRRSATGNGGDRNSRMPRLAAIHALTRRATFSADVAVARPARPELVEGVTGGTG